MDQLLALPAKRCRLPRHANLLRGHAGIINRPNLLCPYCAQVEEIPAALPSNGGPARRGRWVKAWIMLDNTADICWLLEESR